MGSYSEIQKNEARNIDIMDFLAKEEGFDFVKHGRGFRSVQHDSLVIYPDRKGFFWNAQQIGGANAIDWLTKIKGLNFPQAMEKLVGSPNQNYQQNQAKYGQSQSQNPNLQNEKKPFALPPRARNEQRAMAYLMKSRCIGANILNALIEEKKLYQDNRGNAVFVGFDKDTPKYAFKRGTLSEEFLNGKEAYRGEETSSDKRFAFKM
jgi:hypothetical protein